jgi:hypothetical protein
VTDHQHLEALGDPDEAADSDFASEHETTAVDHDITAGRDRAEPESPQGWDGQDEERAP